MSTPSDPTLKLGVMAKYWTPGAVKTRLGAAIGMESAAALHRAFCLHLAKTLRGVADEQAFVVTPAADEAAFAREVDPWPVERQSEGDLGTRMRHWFSAPAAGPQFRVLIGGDCPLVSADTLEKTRSLMSDHDVVFGPARDGGYYLIALHSPWRREYSVLMDEMPWSSDRVLELSCQRAAEAGLRVGLLDTMEDVDTISELDRLREQLKSVAEGPLVELRIQIDQLLGGRT